MPPVPPHPDRFRSRKHLDFVKTLHCLICGGAPPSDPHHLKYVQPRARGLKSGDQWTVPLCRRHHDQVEAAGDEQAWWTAKDLDPTGLARELWSVSHEAV